MIPHKLVEKAFEGQFGPISVANRGLRRRPRCFVTLVAEDFLQVPGSWFGTWVDRTKKYRSEIQGKELRREEYEQTLTVEIKQLPCWAHLSWREYLRRIRELIRTVEAEAAAKRALQETEVVGVQAICEKDPQTRPNAVSTSPAPRVHAATKRERKAWREAFTWFVVAYRTAADLLKEGHLDAPFPEGCFPPGLPYVGDTG